MDALGPHLSPPHTLGVTFGRTLASLQRLLPAYEHKQQKKLLSTVEA